MSKPLKYKCEKYCSLYPCKRESCNRSVLFEDGKNIIMVEPSQYNYYRTKEKQRLYNESRNTYVNN